MLEKIQKKLEYYGYIIFPLILIIILIPLHIKGYVFQDISIETLNSIVNISGIFIGFLITFIGVLLAIPRETRIIQFIIKYGHRKPLIRPLFLSIMLFIITCITALFGLSMYIPIYTFILGVAEMLGVIYYLYHFVKHHFI